jgi:hypothetical protein
METFESHYSQEKKNICDLFGNNVAFVQDLEKSFS